MWAISRCKWYHFRICDPLVFSLQWQCGIRRSYMRDPRFRTVLVLLKLDAYEKLESPFWWEKIISTNELNNFLNSSFWIISKPSFSTYTAHHSFSTKLATCSEITFWTIWDNFLDVIFLRHTLTFRNFFRKQIPLGCSNLSFKLFYSREGRYQMQCECMFKS